MSQDYARALAKVVVAQIAETLGFDSVQRSAGDALAELLLQYVSELGSLTHGYAESASRAECNVNDVLLAFQSMGIEVKEVMEYADNMGDATFAHTIPEFPIAKRPPIFESFAHKGEEPPKHIPAYLPAFPEKHTYIDTPAFKGHTKDAREQKLAQEKAKKDAETALVKLAARSRMGSRPAGEAAPEKLTKPAESGNLFLADPVLEAAAGSNKNGLQPMEVAEPATSVSNVAWEEAGPESSEKPQMLPAPLRLDWTLPTPFTSMHELSSMGFEDAFANTTDEVVETGGRKRRLSLKAKASGDPSTLRAEQILAAGAEAMALEEAAVEKEKGGR